MKKSILIVLLCGIMILGLTGCGKSKDKIEVGAKSDKEISNSGIVLTVKEGTLSKEGATFIISNTTDNSLTFGSDYELEIKKDGEWHIFNVQLNFNDIGYTLNAKEEKEINIAWEGSYYKLDSGEYRVIKKCVFEKDTGENYKGSFYISSEFEIK